MTTPRHTNILTMRRSVDPRFDDWLTEEDMSLPIRTFKEDRSVMITRNAQYRMKGSRMVDLLCKVDDSPGKKCLRATEDGEDGFVFNASPEMIPGTTYEVHLRSLPKIKSRGGWSRHLTLSQGTIRQSPTRR